jgi:hypothetical protein
VTSSSMSFAASSARSAAIEFVNAIASQPAPETHSDTPAPRRHYATATAGTSA